MIFKLTFLVTCVVLGAVPLRAQNDNAVDRHYFRTEGVGVTANDLYFTLKGKDKKIGITDTFRSILYNGQGSGNLVFYKIVPGPDDKPVHVNVAQADISKAGILALLVFTPDPKNPGSYDVKVLPDDLTVFPLGSYRIVNRSSLPVMIMLGKQRAEVAPDESRLVIYPPPATPANVPARVSTPGANGTQQLLYADAWDYSDKFRTEILIKQMTGQGKFISVSRQQDNPSTLLLKQFLPKD